MLHEIEKLRSHLLKTSVLQQSKQQQQQQLNSASSDNLASTPPPYPNNHRGADDILGAIGMTELVSSSSSSSCQWTPNTATTTDSGMESQKSEATLISRPTTRASSIPRPVACRSPIAFHSKSSANLMNSSFKSDELNYSGYSRDELVQLVKQLASENVIVKRQVES